MFVYGTLKKGFFNHYFLDGVEIFFVSSYKIIFINLLH